MQPHPDLPLLIDLQSVDSEIARLNAEIAALPKHVAEIESRLKGHVDKLENDKKMLAAHYKQRKDFEREIGIIREKIGKYRDQMTAVKTNDQYRALQHEIDFAEKGIREYEDKILEKMVLDEELEGAVKKAQAALDAEKKEVEKEKATIAARTAHDSGLLEAQQVRRKELVGQISELAYSEYTRLSRRPPAIVLIRNSACMGCRVMLRPQAMNEVKSNSRLYYCESCKRLLYYDAANSTVLVDREQASSGSN